jgi:hypothetical protein
MSKVIVRAKYAEAKTLGELYELLGMLITDDVMGTMPVRLAGDDENNKGVKVSILFTDEDAEGQTIAPAVTLSDVYIDPEDILAPAFVDVGGLKPFEKTIEDAMLRVIERQMRPGGLLNDFFAKRVTIEVLPEFIEAENFGDGGKPYEAEARYPTHAQVQGSGEYQGAIVPGEFTIPAGAGPGARVRVGTTPLGESYIEFCDGSGNGLSKHVLNTYVVPRAKD